MEGISTVTQAVDATLINRDATLARAGRLAQTVQSGTDGSRANQEAAEEFEALLSTLLVKEMRGSLSTGFFGEGEASDVYSGWFDEQFGRSLADSGALDLVGMVKAGLGEES